MYRGMTMLSHQEFGRADLHMHTTASDGMASVQELLDYVAGRGHLDVRRRISSARRPEGRTVLISRP